MSASFLKKCSRIYEVMVQEIEKSHAKMRTETLFQLIHRVAQFAWFNHTGRYADGRLENILFALGRNLEVEDNEMPARKPLLNYKRKILHVATELHKVGGHTKIIKNWIEKDNESSHSLALINQKDPELPDWVSEFESSGGEVTIFNLSESIQNKSQQLRKLAKSGFDMILLHHHPDDVVPCVAFAVKELPPVAIINHADHVFWLGSSVADNIVSLRESGQILSEDRRYGRTHSLLPLPLREQTIFLDKNSARHALGIPDGQTVLLTIGSENKYLPNAKKNFFKTVSKILDKYSNAHLYLIGPSPRIKIDAALKHERMHFLGIVENPSIYHRAADIYLDGFPFGSITALLEASISGLPPVLAYAPESKLLVTEDLSFSGLLDFAKDESDYLFKVGNLIENPVIRKNLAEQVKAKILSYHSNEKWGAYLNHFYATLSTTDHKPSLLAGTQSLETADDLELAAFEGAAIDANINVYKWTDRNHKIIPFSLIFKLFWLALTHGEIKTIKRFKLWIDLFRDKSLSASKSYKTENVPKDYVFEKNDRIGVRKS